MPYRYGWGEINSSSSINKIPADLYFSDFNGNWNVDGDGFTGEPAGYRGDSPDYYSEIFVGRLLCQNVTEVSSWVKKAITYEQNPFYGNYGKLTKSLWSQSDEMQRDREAQKVDSTNISPTFASFTQKYIEESPSCSSYTPTYPSGSDIINELNLGYGFYNMYNHGEAWDILVRCAGIHDTANIYRPYRYGLEGRDSDDVNFTIPYVQENGNGLDNITKENTSTVIYSISCSVAQFDEHDAALRSLADLFTTRNESGGPAFLGNTRVGWVGTPYYLHEEFIKSLFNDKLYHLGEAEAQSKSNNSVDKHYLAYTHNLFGDPEMPVWTAYPSTFSSLTVQDNVSSITINSGVSDAYICVSSMDNGQTYFVRTLGNGTFNTSIRPLYITVTRQNYIPYVAITGGTLTSNETWSGQMIVLGNITIPSRKSLTINQGANLTFKNGTSLINNGTLTIAGTATNKVNIDFVSPCSGNGVKFNLGSTGTISYANIKNAYYGVRATNSSPNLSSITFTGNYYGVYCDNYGSPTLKSNTISGSSIGVSCNYNSSPYLTAAPYGSGNNVITQNGYGVDTYMGSSPFIGGTYSGNNSIFGNSNYNLHAAYGGTVYAYHTWWGSYPISSQDLSKIYSYQATVDYTQPLSSDPNAGRPLSKIIYAENSSNQGQSSSGSEDVLLQGLSLQAEGKYSEAISSYVNVIKNNMKTSKAISALAKLSDCYQLTGRNDFIDYLNSSIRPNLSKEDDISITVLELENFWLTKQVKYDQVIKNIGKIKSDYPDKKESYKYALFNEGFTYYAFLKDSSKAKDSFSKLQKLYPEDPLVVESKILLGEDPGNLPAPKLMPGNAIAEENEVKTSNPTSFDLLGNYPNPFNPTTLIRYDIPSSSKVELKIYDILGKEVMTLVNGIQEAGRYNASFNASGLPSGIYIYSFKALSVENGKSFEKNSKMLYLK